MLKNVVIVLQYLMFLFFIYIQVYKFTHRMYTTKVKFREKYSDSHEVYSFKYFKKMLLKEKIFVYPNLKSP
jgi:hypothetical protein